MYQTDFKGKVIGSPPFNINHLKPQPDLPLTLKPSTDCLSWTPNRNLPFDISFVVNPVLVRPHNFFWIPLCVFVQICFKPLAKLTRQEHVSNVSVHNVTGSLNLTPLTRNPVQTLFSVTRVHLHFVPLSEPFLNLWGTMRGFIESLKLWFYPKWRMLSH